jgi:adenylate cyclase
MSGVWQGVRRLNERVLSIGAHEHESPEHRGARRILVGALAYSLLPTFLAGLAEPGAWLVALSMFQAAVHTGALLWIHVNPYAFRAALTAVFATGLATDVTRTLLQGGLFESGLRVTWILIASVGALIGLSVRAAYGWFAAFVAAVIASGVASSVIEEPVYVRTNRVESAVVALVGTTLIVFLALVYFVRQRDRFQRQSDELLHNVLPDQIADRLKAGEGRIADRFEGVSVVFADVVDFTPMSSRLSAEELVGLLDDVFTDLDAMADELGLEKIKTAGDEYMAAAGVPTPREDHALAAAELALRIQQHAEDAEYRGHRISFRIGINSGPVVAGVIGTRKFSYDLWGDVVNTASRMESHGVPGCIQISPATHALLADRYVCEPRGVVDVKGKGPMQTWLLLGRR